MGSTIDYQLLGLAVILLLSVLASKVTDRFGVPALVLHSKNLGLKGELKPLLELESGSNDPMAVLLTVGLVQMITQPVLSPAALLLLFGLQLHVGSAAGAVMGLSWARGSCSSPTA